MKFKLDINNQKRERIDKKEKEWSLGEMTHPLLDG